MSFDDRLLSGDKAGLYKAIMSSRKTQQIRMLGILVSHYYKDDPFLFEVGQFLFDDQRSSSLKDVLSKNRLIRILVDVERMEDPSLSFEKTLELVADRLQLDSMTGPESLRRAYSRGGEGAPQDGDSASGC